MLTNDAQQSLAADGAIACFSSNLVPRCLNADRAPQLKADVMRFPFGEEKMVMMYMMQSAPLA
jgi:hypothetical protein